MNQIEDYRTRVEKLLRKHGVNAAPVPVERIAKDLGAMVRYWDFEEELSGMIYVKGKKPIIGVNSSHHQNRQRFTIAHEIAHLVLHSDVIGDVIHVDKRFNVLMRDANSATGTQRIEMQANRFAAELLMPTFILIPMLRKKGYDIDDERPIEELSQRFGVSKLALEYRIQNLNHSALY